MLNRFRKNKTPWTSLILAASISLVSSTGYADGKGGVDGGGGHGVRSHDGALEFLDSLVTSKNGAQKVQTPIDLFQDPLTTDAAAGVLSRIGQIEQSYPRFGKALKARFQGMNWALTSYPLEPVKDADLSPEFEGVALLQMMRQKQHKEKCDVLIDAKMMAEVDLAVRERMIIHELLLCKISLGMPRKTVRNAGKAIHYGDLGLLKKELDALSPAILEGHFRVVLRFGVRDGSVFNANVSIAREGWETPQYDFSASKGVLYDGTEHVMMDEVLTAGETNFTLWVVGRPGAEYVLSVEINGVPEWKVSYTLQANLERLRFQEDLR